MTVRTGISTFRVGAKRFRFKDPLMLESEKVEGGLCLAHKELSLSACGKSWSECDEIIREELATLWEEYALAPDDELTVDAIALKNKLLGMVDELK